MNSSMIMQFISKDVLKLEIKLAYSWLFFQEFSSRSISYSYKGLFAQTYLETTRTPKKLRKKGERNASENSLWQPLMT